jgi:hypothetical protein
MPGHGRCRDDPPYVKRRHLDELETYHMQGGLEQHNDDFVKILREPFQKTELKPHSITSENTEVVWFGRGDRWWSKLGCTGNGELATMVMRTCETHGWKASCLELMEGMDGRHNDNGLLVENHTLNVGGETWDLRIRTGYNGP